MQSELFHPGMRQKLQRKGIRINVNDEIIFHLKTGDGKIKLKWKKYQMP